MDFEKLIIFRNKNNAFANLMNLKITKVSLGYAQAELPVTSDLLNPIGSVHGGCIFTIADVAGGAAASSYGEHVTTVDGNIHYLRAGLDTKKLIATAKVLKQGKRVLVFDISVADQDGVLLAAGIFTFMSLGKKITF